MLRAIYDSKEDIPAEYIHLFQEKKGKWEIQIEGMKTLGDVERLQGSLDSERADHGRTKVKLRAYNWVGDLNEEGVTALRDEVEDLKADGKKGKSDEEIESLVEKRVERALRKPAKQIEQLTAENASHLKAIGLHEAAGNQRLIRDHVEDVLGNKDTPNVVDGAREDILPFAERIMTVRDGKVVTKEGCSFDPGVDFSEVLSDIKAEGRRAHWFPGSKGVGAKDGEGGGGGGGNNPFHKDSFNMTEAQAIIAADKPRAHNLAKQAGRKDLIDQFRLDK